MPSVHGMGIHCGVIGACRRLEPGPDGAHVERLASEQQLGRPSVYPAEPREKPALVYCRLCLVFAPGAGPPDYAVVDKPPPSPASLILDSTWSLLGTSSQPVPRGAPDDSAACVSMSRAYRVVKKSLQSNSWSDSKDVEFVSRIDAGNSLYTENFLQKFFDVTIPVLSKIPQDSIRVA